MLTSGRGDEYNEIYAGLNYYIYGHNLKLQTGWSYETMHDRAGDGGRYAGWCWTTGLRVRW
jgi:phosphate-selective porin OprO/OprP